MKETEELDRNGRKKYLTKEAFNEWKSKDFCQLVRDMKLNRKRLIGILFATVAVPTAFFICIVQLVIR